jgi:hypothetical protein
VSLFAEYKLSQQWAVELEEQPIKELRVRTNEQRGLSTFDFQKHHFVVGLCYHFL